MAGKENSKAKDSKYEIHQSVVKLQKGLNKTFISQSHKESFLIRSIISGFLTFLIACASFVSTFLDFTIFLLFFNPSSSFISTLSFESEWSSALPFLRLDNQSAKGISSPITQVKAPSI